MNTSYKIKVNQGTGEAKFVDIPQVGPSGKALTVKAVPGGKYQLMDASTGYAPENIRASRSGKDLQVFFERRGQPDLVIEDYYEVTPEGFNGLIGESESGRFYEYIPETATGSSSVPLLADGSNQVGMALGGAEINASGAAVGALVAAAGFNPLLLAPLALLGAGGGGGGGATDNTAPIVKFAKLHVDDDSGAKDNVTSDKTPRITGETEANADVSVEVNGKTYIGKADANGVFVIQVPDADALKDGAYTPKVTAMDAAKNKSPVFDGTPFKVDTSPDKNEPDTDPNASALIDIVSITVDSGQNKTDFYTNDNQLLFNGTLKNFTQNGDWVKLELKDASGKVLDTAYVKPVANGAGWDWSWDRTAKEKMIDGQYSLSAVVVDGADNVVGSGNSRVSDVQVITIDTDKDNNFGPDKAVDPNKSSTVDVVSLSQDTGFSSSDFITKDRTHVYTGKLSAFTSNGAAVELTLKDASGKVLATEHVTPKQVSGVWAWSWDRTANAMPDGEYALQASLIDKAGNPIHSDTQLISVDNSSNENGGKVDPNASLKMMPVTFADDTGVSSTDYLTNDRLLTFKGGFDKDFVNNGDRVLVQVFGSDGLVISPQYVLPSGKTWEFENLTELGSDAKAITYTVKSVLVDAAGNTLQATDQSFVIDRSVSIFDGSGAKKEAGLWTYSTIKFSSDEQGT
jgi:flagellar hook assembly protein FlgD